MPFFLVVDFVLTSGYGITNEVSVPVLLLGIFMPPLIGLVLAIVAYMKRREGFGWAMGAIMLNGSLVAVYMLLALVDFLSSHG